MSAATSDQLTALRTGAALCTPDSRFLARAHGTDVLPWLERILSMPVTELTAGHFVRAMLMDGKGKLRMDLRVIAAESPTQGLLLDLPLADKQKTLRLLDMYVITEDVSITDLSAELRSASVLGPDSASTLRSLNIEPPDDGCVAMPRNDVYVMPTTLSATPGYDLFFDGAVGRDLLDEVLAAGAVRVETPALQIARVAAGVPWFADDLSNDIIPLEANLDEHVSTSKGCYPGQEVVARILNLGQIARRLMCLKAPGSHETAPGTELTSKEGKAAGVLTSIAYDPSTDTTHALGFVKRPFWEEGSQLTAGVSEFSVRGPARGQTPDSES